MNLKIKIIFKITVFSITPIDRKKVMVSDCVTLGIRASAKLNRIINNNTISQDSVPSHRANIVQDFLKEKLAKKVIKHAE